jgi:hypothetical protein
MCLTQSRKITYTRRKLFSRNFQFEISIFFFFTIGEKKFSLSHRTFWTLSSTRSKELFRNWLWNFHPDLALTSHKSTININFFHKCFCDKRSNETVVVERLNKTKSGNFFSKRARESFSPADALAVLVSGRRHAQVFSNRSQAFSMKKLSATLWKMSHNTEWDWSV